MAKKPFPPPSPLNWTQQGDDTWIVECSIIYRIQRLRRPSRPYRLTLDDTHGPEWHFDTLEAAKAKAEDINYSAPLYAGEEDWRPAHWPVVISEGEQTRPLDPQPEEVPAAPARCRKCGSQERPVAVKPLRYTLDWWDDPAISWKCPHCGSYTYGG